MFLHEFLKQSNLFELTNPSVGLFSGAASAW